MTSTQKWKARGNNLPSSWSPTIFTKDIEPTRDYNHYWAGSALTIEMHSIVYQRMLPKVYQGDLVDLGCGTAPLLGNYHNKVKSYCLVDWPSSLHENKVIDIFADLNLPLGIPDSEFDSAILTSVLEHIRYPEHLLSEIARILRPGGRMFLQVPFAYWLHEEPYDYFRYTKHGLIALLESSGLQIEQIESVGNLKYVAIDLTIRWLHQKGRLFQKLGSLLQKIAFRLFQRNWIPGNQSNMPLGYALIARKPPISTLVPPP